MKISINCKLDPHGAVGFIKPIADIEQISEINVFRDQKALFYHKVNYYKPPFNLRIFNQLAKLIQMLIKIKKDTKLAIGIYEIPHGLLAFLIGKLKGIPVIISIIGNPGYTKIRKGFRKKITYFMLHRINSITVTGNQSKQYLINDGIPRNKIYILPNSIDVKKFKSLSKVEKRYDIISLGRLSPEKELGNLLKIVNILKKTNTNIRVGIAGKGPEKERLEKMIIELSLQSNIHLLGYVNDIVEFYNSGKVFVLTSHTEGLPRTVVEAMACGVSCVASNIGDMEDVIDDGVSGNLIQDYRNLNEFADKIETILENNEIYNRFSEQAIRKIRNNYSYEAATKVWEIIINKIYGENYVT